LHIWHRKTKQNKIKSFFSIRAEEEEEEETVCSENNNHSEKGRYIQINPHIICGDLPDMPQK